MAAFHPLQPLAVTLAGAWASGKKDRMRAELRRILTTSHDTLDTIQLPADAFCISLRALIGPVGSEGEESFDFDVCSPQWLAAEVERHPLVSGRFLLITRRFNAAQVEEYVRKRVSQASGDDWPSIAAKLARWSQWEFDDYRER